ncbi:hypothetical protein HMPREF9078_00297 [Capnocytophaga sp. oral taxon 380 str. F0488]|nr:hypothetical protein HMPREF9078_00297 [Capnocytophaga sp. oral taxon 380 str. F0488]
MSRFYNLGKDFYFITSQHLPIPKFAHLLITSYLCTIIGKVANRQINDEWFIITKK